MSLYNSIVISYVNICLIIPVKYANMSKGKPKKLSYIILAFSMVLITHLNMLVNNGVNIHVCIVCKQVCKHVFKHDLAHI